MQPLRPEGTFSFSAKEGPDVPFCLILNSPEDDWEACYTTLRNCVSGIAAGDGSVVVGLVDSLLDLDD